MKVAYRALASLVLLLVVVQAADLPFGFFGVGARVDAFHGPDAFVLFWLGMTVAAAAGSTRQDASAVAPTAAP